VNALFRLAIVHSSHVSRTCFRSVAVLLSLTLHLILHIVKSMAWEVQFYEEEDGSYPVEKFLDSLPQGHFGKVQWVIDRLEELGPSLRFPYSSQVEGKLRELRAWYGKTLYRVLYYGDADRRFVLLHAIKKNAEKLPEANKQLGLRRMRRDMEDKHRERSTR